MDYTYKIGNYVQQEYFNRLVDLEKSAVLIYCEQEIVRTYSSKHSGIWHLYAYSAETDNWHPLVKVELHTKRMLPKLFTSADGVINSIIRLNLPVSAITTTKGSGCEISKDGSIYYRPQCILI